MDRLMQPSRLDLDANSSSASKEWCHWFVTFGNYIEVLDASLARERRTNKLKALVNCVSHRVFEYIANCDSYGEIFFRKKTEFMSKISISQDSLHTGKDVTGWD